MNFKGKTACVTGAAVGIGRAVALELAKLGAAVVLWDVDQKNLELLQEELREIGAEVLSSVCDVSDEKSVAEAAEKAIAHFGKVDILVNNAALWREWSSFTEISTEQWKRYFDINVMGTVYATRAFLPGMIEREYGRVINVASVAGVYGNAKMVCYSATKGAIISMTKALAKEVADKGVLVNAVSPGSVSPSNERDIDFTKPSELSFMGRTGSDRENANLIVFLASDEASYISAQNIQIDGCRKKQ